MGRLLKKPKVIYFIAAVILLTVGFLFLAPLRPQAAGNTYYIKSSGSDTANGLSDANAWKTLGHASTQLHSGDTLLLKRGNSWTGQTLDIGLGINGLTIDAYGTGVKPIIDNTSKEDNDVGRGPNDYPCIQIGVAYQTITSNTVIKNLDLRGPHKGSAIDIQNAQGTKIYNTDFRGAGWSSESLIMVRGVSTGMLIENCFFDQITGNSEGYSKSIEFRYGSGAIVKNSIFKGYKSGGAVRYSNQAHNGLIENNYFYQPDTRSSDAWAIVIRSQNEGTVIIRNNVIDMTNNGGLSGSHLRGIVSWYDEGAVTRKIFNNVMISDGAGYGIHQGGSTNLAYNNIFYNLQTGWNNIEANTAKDTTLRNNIFYNCDQKYNDGTPTETGSLTTNPNLANPSMSNHLAQDAKIQVGSAAINTGYSNDADIPSTDFEGNSRVGTIDIGAFEYGGVVQTCSSQGYYCCSTDRTCTQPRSGSGCATGDICCASQSACISETTQTCSQLGGTCCQSGQTCPATDLNPTSDCVTICCSELCQEPPTGQLISYWPLDNNANDVVDSNHGTLSGPTYTTGYLNQALSFDGVNDYVDIGNFDVLGNTLTITAWIKADRFDHLSSHDGRIISKSISTSEQDHYFMLSSINSNGDKLRFRLKTNGQTTTLIANSGNLQPGVWTHVAAVYDGNNMLLYQDGQLVGQTSKTGSIDTNNTIPVWLGNNPPDSTSRPFAGLIDEVKIYNQALSQAQIQADLSGQTTQCLLPDLDNNTTIDQNDLTIFKILWTTNQADFNNDLKTNTQDLGILMSVWGDY